MDLSNRFGVPKNIGLDTKHARNAILNISVQSHLRILAPKMGVVKKAISPTGIFGLLIFFGSRDPKEVTKQCSDFYSNLQVYSLFRA